MNEFTSVEAQFLLLKVELLGHFELVEFVDGPLFTLLIEEGKGSVEDWVYVLVQESRQNVLHERASLKELLLVVLFED